MYTRRNIRLGVVLNFAWKPLVLFTAWSSIVTIAYFVLEQRGVDISLPLAPLGTIGVAVAFYIGFKNNQSYDRYWEARKIWGGIVNVSRTWANQVLTFVATHAGDSDSTEELAQIHRTLVYRHLAWINALRFQLRRPTSFGLPVRGVVAKYMQETDIGAMRESLNAFLNEHESEVVCDRVNSATQILRLQGEHLRRLANEEPMLDAFRQVSLMDSIRECYTLQGKCERIKNTPFPRQYAHFSYVFVWIFVALLPFGIVGEFSTATGRPIWLSIPLSVLVSWIFVTMETVGDTSEDPFENFMNDVPMTALCRTIEIDLRQMLGEQDVPPKLEPVGDVLM